MSALHADTSTHNALLTVGTQVLNLGYDTAVTIASACAKASRRGGYVPLSPNILMWVTHSTPISVVSEGTYEQYYEQMLRDDGQTDIKPHAVVL